MYLLAYKPADTPPASNPPGLKMSAASFGPKAPKEGIWNDVAAFLNSIDSLKPTFCGFTFEGSENTLGKPMNVYAKTTSFVIVGLNTCVNVPVTESERFFPSTELGYGTWSPLRHHRPTGNNCVSRCKL